MVFNPNTVPVLEVDIPPYCTCISDIKEFYYSNRCSLLAENIEGYNFVKRNSISLPLSAPVLCDLKEIVFLQEDQDWEKINKKKFPNSPL